MFKNLESKIQAFNTCIEIVSVENHSQKVKECLPVFKMYTCSAHLCVLTLDTV